jgi:hypothetical protein
MIITFNGAHPLKNWRESKWTTHAEMNKKFIFWGEKIIINITVALKQQQQIYKFFP